MKPKNVMLLGFVNRAVEYLDKHMDEEPDTRLAELKNIDLASLRDELSDNLDVSLGTMESTMSTLLKAGNEAFDKFVDGSNSKSNIVNEIDRLFDVDFDETRKNNQKQLAKLLSFYNLEDDFDVDESLYTLPVSDEEVEKPIVVNDEQKFETSAADEKFLKEIVKNAGVQATAEVKPAPAAVKPAAPELDSVLNEIVKNESAKQETSPKPQENNQTYVSSLIEDLKNQFEKEETLRKQKEDKNREAYERINKLYTYLPKDMVHTIYDLKDDLTQDYPNDKKVIVMHRVSFREIDNLRKFVEIVLNHQYAINADENKKIVDVFKEFTNGNDKILTNIFEIANQGVLLGGEYEGYNVLMDDED